MSVARERVAVRDVDVSRFFQSSRDSISDAPRCVKRESQRKEAN